MRPSRPTPSDSSGHVGTGQLAEPRELVDEGDLGREEGVGGVFDQLRRLHGRGHDQRAPLAGERQVEVLQDLPRRLRLRADDDAVGLHEVVDGVALAQELRVGGDREAVARRSLRRRSPPPSGSCRRGTVDLVTKTVKPVSSPRAALSPRSRRPRRPRQRRRNPAWRCRRRRVGVPTAMKTTSTPPRTAWSISVVKRERTVGGVRRHQIGQARFVDRDIAFAQPGDLESRRCRRRSPDGRFPPNKRP